MSVMHISNNHISTILRYVEINSFPHRNPYFKSYYSDDLKKIGKKIRKLNNEAWSNRYSDKDSYKEPFTFKDIDKNKIELINELCFKKLIDFVEYNIDEANETKEKDELVKLLDEWKNNALNNMVYYRESVWGID